jgi:uncharacterized protein (DUF2236 family)
MSPRTAATCLDAPAPVLAVISREVNAERVALLGWGRAILLQLAHPLIAAGVYDHSSFRASPWTAASRLHATVHAMLSLTFGTEDGRNGTLAAIRAIHRRVNGRLSQAVGPYPAGTPYSAEDPALVEWVHLTLLESVPMVYELFVAPLTEAQRDSYCEEAAAVALALGARDDQVPRTSADMTRRLAQAYASGSIVVGPQARELAAVVLSPGIGRLVPPAAWLNRLVTTGLLPPHLRSQYGFAWSDRRQRAFERVIPAVRAVRRRAPQRMALWADARS